MLNEQDIAKEIESVHQRNQRVEADKAWETSKVRRGSIALVTYVVAGVWLGVLHDESPWLKALIPTGGYLFSTLSLPFIKRWWLKRFYKR